MAGRKRQRSSGPPAPIRPATLGLLRTYSPSSRVTRKGVEVIRHCLPYWTPDRDAHANAVDALVEQWGAACDALPTMTAVRLKLRGRRMVSA